MRALSVSDLKTLSTCFLFKNVDEIQEDVFRGVVFENHGGTGLVGQTGGLGEVLVGLSDGDQAVGVDEHSFHLYGDYSRNLGGIQGENWGVNWVVRFYGHSLFGRPSGGRGLFVLRVYRHSLFGRPSGGAIVLFCVFTGILFSVGPPAAREFSRWISDFTDTVLDVKPLLRVW